MTTKHYARPVDGIVVEVKDLPDDFDLDALFGPDHGWVEAQAEVAQGWLYKGKKFSAPLASHPEMESLLSGLKAEASRHIFATISATAQSNLLLAVSLASAKAASARTAEERDLLATAEEGRAWIDAVRAWVRVLTDNGGVTPEGHGRWPEPNAAVRDLAARF
jgi:hypothetical protein